MKIKISGILTALILIASGCDSAKEDEVQVINKDNVKEVKMSQISYQVHFTPLETNEGCVIGYVDKAVNVGDRLFILSSGMTGGKELFSFDSKGRFLKKIGNRGNAQSEYIDIKTFFVLGKEVYIIDAQKEKVIKYDVDGNFLESMPLDNSLKFSREYTALNGDTVLAANGICFEETPQLYQTVNAKTMEVVKEISNTEYYYYGDTFFAKNSMADDDEDILLLYPLDKSIYAINKNTLSVTKRLQIDYLGSVGNVTTKDYEEAKEKITDAGTALLQDIYKYGQTLFVHFSTDDCLFWDMEKHEGIYVAADNEVEDDGKIPFTPQYLQYADNEGIHAVIPAADLMLCLEDFYNKSKNCTTELPNITFASNPVIVTYSNFSFK